MIGYHITFCCVLCWCWVWSITKLLISLLLSLCMYVCMDVCAYVLCKILKNLNSLFKQLIIVCFCFFVYMFVRVCMFSPAKKLKNSTYATKNIQPRDNEFVICMYLGWQNLRRKLPINCIHRSNIRRHWLAMMKLFVNILWCLSSHFRTYILNLHKL